MNDITNPIKLIVQLNNFKQARHSNIQLHLHHFK